MSRSYKKFPIIKDRFKPKTFANRAVRRYKEVPIGKSCFFKKVFCSWDICDYRCVDCMNETEVTRRWKNDNYRYRECRTPKEALWEYKKYYLNK
ncbi:MAG: hypothetical protein K2O29_01245 [Ruminococcus sp.]|nr:hypothetical protein [Ruminococcus sp.]MDE6847839.1 hypothetical protein [Ruminococcus sp.]MDE7137073.1 hypothetical protein [Ruminococcus sp.]